MSSNLFDLTVHDVKELPVAAFLDAVVSSKISSHHGVSVGLLGDLGAGKTTFVRACAHYLRIPSESVTSPTYTLQQTYLVPAGSPYPSLHAIEHWDLYRLGGLPPELLERVAPFTVQLIEWADKFDSVTDYSLQFELKADGSRRLVLTSR